MKKPIRLNLILTNFPFLNQGWTTDGTNPSCTVDVDECSGDTPRCSRNPNVQCINLPGSFRYSSMEASIQ